MFNNIFCLSRNRGVNINYFSNFERGGLYLSPFTVNNKCIKGRMNRLNNSLIFFNKIWFFYHIQTVFWNIFLEHTSFQWNQKTKYVFALMHFFFPFSFNTIFFFLFKSSVIGLPPFFFYFLFFIADLNSSNKATLSITKALFKTLSWLWIMGVWKSVAVEAWKSKAVGDLDSVLFANLCNAWEKY